MEDLFYPILATYRKLPISVQNSIGVVYRNLPNRLRFGRFYKEYLMRIQNFIGSSSTKSVEDLQLDLLKSVVNTAIVNVPFYEGYSEVNQIIDIQQFPIINKADIVNNRYAFIAQKYKKKCLIANTGGSSGTPMEFCLHSGKTRSKESAHFDWFWGQYGFRPGARVLMIRGAPLRNNALYEYQAIKNCFAVSCYELNSSNINDVLEKILVFQPEFIHGYPSAVKNFMHCINDEIPTQWKQQIKAIFLGSEWLSKEDRRVIESFFNTKVANWYGHSECGAMAGNSIDSDEYYFYPFYGYTELLDENNAPVSTPGQIGRIVVTGFDNYVMPFIRYDTGDWGMLSENCEYFSMPCLVLKSIEGRMQDFIYLYDNTKVSLTAFIFGQHLPQFSKIREMQLEQKERGFITIRIVKGVGFSEKDARELIGQLTRSVSNKITIDLEYVKRIEKTHRGKHRFLVQTVKN